MVYAAVFGGSLFSLLGGDGAPDLLRLRNNGDAAPATVADVLSAQSGESPAVAAPDAAQPTPRQIPRVPEAQPPVDTTAPVQKPADAPAPTTAIATASVSGQHLVRSGDTLSQLGVLYHVDVGALKLINGLGSDMIYTGQTLVVPRPVEASTISVPGLGEGGMPGD